MGVPFFDRCSLAVFNKGKRDGYQIRLSRGSDKSEEYSLIRVVFRDFIVQGGVIGPNRILHRTPMEMDAGWTGWDACHHGWLPELTDKKDLTSSPTSRFCASQDFAGHRVVQGMPASLIGNCGSISYPMLYFYLLKRTSGRRVTVVTAMSM